MQTIKIDFDNPGFPQRLDVVENDAQSRFFKAVLYKDGKAYTAPSGAKYSIMYRGFGPQNEGWYDTINDGAGKRAACSVSGNVVTCEIARQALRVPGHVSVMLCVTRSNGYMLHGWPIDCNCRNDSYTNGTSVESFFYITQVTNADWNSAIQAWEELKNMIDPTLSLSGKAADAAKVGEAVNAEAERTKGVESQLKEDIADIKKDVLEEVDITGEIKSGIAIDARDGRERRDINEHCKATDFIEIDLNYDYYYTGYTFNYVGIAGYDSEGNYLASILRGESAKAEKFVNYKLIIPNEVKKIRASSYGDSTNSSIVEIKKVIVYGEVAFNNIIKIDSTLSNSNYAADAKIVGESLAKLNDKIDEIATTYLYVSKNGNDETGNGSHDNPFATIYEANKSITDASYKKRYIIKVEDGIYTDLQEKYAGIKGTSYQGVICKDYVYYEGNVIHPENVVIKWDGTFGFNDKSTVTLADVFNKAPFHIIGNIQGQHTGISGFSFDCQDIRYCVHPEMESRGFNNCWYISHCNFLSWRGRPTIVQNGNNGNQSMPAIGMGSGIGEIGVIDSCIFPKRPSNSDICKDFHFGIVNHDNKPNYNYGSQLFRKGSNYTIKNCYLNDNDIVLRNLYDIDYQVSNFAWIINCNAISKIILYKASVAHEVWKVDVISSNNPTIQM